MTERKTDSSMIGCTLSVSTAEEATLYAHCAFPHEYCRHVWANRLELIPTRHYSTISLYTLRGLSSETESISTNILRDLFGFILFFT